MKKLALIAMLLSFSLFACNNNDDKPKQVSTISPLVEKKITLNGLSYDTAKNYVQNFLTDTMSSDNQTNIWFGQEFIKGVYGILKYEGGDGVRIYFAKNNNKKNTIVVVSTKDGGPNTYCDTPNSPKCNKSKRIHQDYFEHSTSLLDSGFMKNTDDFGLAEGINVSCIKKECPPNENDVSCDQILTWRKNFNGGKLNTTSVWYSIKLIKKLKAELLAAQVEGTNADGIRIYFARNDKGKDGFVMVSTKSDGKNNHIDFYECYSNKKAFFPLYGGNDHGEECPIFCAGATLK